MSSSIPPIPTRSLTPPPSAAEAAVAAAAQSAAPARAPSLPPGGAVPDGLVRKPSSEFNFSDDDSQVSRGRLQPSRARFLDRSQDSAAGEPADTFNKSGGMRDAFKRKAKAAVIAAATVSAAGGAAVAGAAAGAASTVGATRAAQTATGAQEKSQFQVIMRAREGLKESIDKRNNALDVLQKKLSSTSVLSPAEVDATVQIILTSFILMGTGLAEIKVSAKAFAEENQTAEGKSSSLVSASKTLESTRATVKKVATQLQDANAILNQIRAVPGEDMQGRNGIIEKNATLITSGQLDSATAAHVQTQIDSALANVELGVAALKVCLTSIDKAGADEAFTSVKAWKAEVEKLISAAKEMQVIVTHEGTNKPEARETLVSKINGENAIPQSEADSIKADLMEKAQVAQSAMAEYKLSLSTASVSQLSTQAVAVRAAQTELDNAMTLARATVVRAEISVLQASNRATLAEVSPELASFASEPETPFVGKNVAETVQNSLKSAMVNTAGWVTKAEQTAKDPACAEKVAVDTKVHAANLHASLAWAVDFAAFANKPKESA
jgi:hypothetical protein